MRLSIYLFVLLLCSASLQAQKQNTIEGSGFISHFKIGAGLSVFSIQAGDDNLNIESLMASRNENKTVFGGQMGGGHPGYHIQLNAYLDAEEDYRIPIGFSHNLMSSANTEPVSSQGILMRYKHNIDLMKINAGLHFAIWDLDSSEAKIFVGPELMYSFISNSDFNKRLDYLDPNRQDIDYQGFSKENASRFGGLLRLGVEGHLHKRMYINIGIGFGCLNLFGRDDERGELFTYTNRIEIQESYVYFFDFSLILQYHL